MNDDVVFFKPGADDDSEPVTPTGEQIQAMVDDGLFMPGSWINPEDPPQ